MCVYRHMLASSLKLANRFVVGKFPFPFQNKQAIFLQPIQQPIGLCRGNVEQGGDICPGHVSIFIGQFHNALVVVGVVRDRLLDKVGFTGGHFV